MSDVDLERDWWDTHTDRIFVWGEHEDGSWNRGIRSCLPLVTRGLWGPNGERGVRGPILDLGCGPGRLSLPLAQMFPGVLVVGVDLSVEMLRRAVGDLTESEVTNLLYLAGNGRTIPALGVGPLAGVFSVLMFQHIPAPAVSNYIRQIGDLLAPGGRFVAQYVTDANVPTTSAGSFLSWSHSPPVVESWGNEAGMDVVSTESGLVYPEWVWTTMEKR